MIKISIANPASVYCKEVWWTSSIQTKTDWNQYGICYFDDNRQCEEWALFKWDCLVWWRKITWYLWEYAKYCAISWNNFIYKETIDDVDYWDCELKNSKKIDAKTYYFLENLMKKI